MTPQLDATAIIVICLTFAFCLALPVARYHRRLQFWSRFTRSPQHDAGGGRDGERAEAGTVFHSSSDSDGAQHRNA